MKAKENFPIPKKALTIAGAESGGTAGIQADLKTFQEIGVYGMSVITAIVGRHPKTDKNVHPINIEAIEAQFDTAVSRSGGIDGVKIGMLFSTEVIEVIAHLLKEAQFPHLVVDPVMVGKLDSKLLNEDAIESLKKHIIPQADIITPNMAEATVLTGKKMQTIDDLVWAAEKIYQLGCRYVLVKGGRLENAAVDVLYDGRQVEFFESQRFDTQNTSGAGCSYSSAIAAYLAKGLKMSDAIYEAKRFVSTAISKSFSFTSNPGPVNQLANRNPANRVEVRRYP